MIPRKNKLNLKHKDNQLIWRSAHKVMTDSFQAAYDFEGENPQMAVVITKKVLPKAVNRNQLRRMIYDSLISEVIKMDNLRLAIRVRSASLLGKDDEQLNEIFTSLLEEILTTSKGR